MARKLTATQRLRQNVRRQIRRMEKSGYIIDAQIKENIPTAKYQTLKSYQRNKYSKLYEESIAEYQGQIVSGTTYKRERAKEAARRGTQSYFDWETTRREQDMLDRLNAEQYREGELVYDNIVSLINHYPTNGSKALSDILDSEISKYGKDAVIRSMANAPEEATALATVIAYYEEESSAINSAIVEFTQIITGTIPTAEEAKDLGEIMDIMTDFGSR